MPPPERKVCYIHWRDAAMHTDETNIEKMDLIDVYEVGWLLRETDEQVTLGIEHPGGSYSTRLALSIPKVNIVERREFVVPRPRRKRPTVLTPEPDQEQTLSREM